MGNIIINSKIAEEKRNFILAIIDPQYDFFENGALAVKDSNKIIGPINKLRFYCEKKHMETFFSQDYHPSKHMSFASTHNLPIYSNKNLTFSINGEDVNFNQTLWTDHCLSETDGAKFHRDIIKLKTDKVFRKGTKRNIESYSAFGDEFGNKYENTGLHNWLRSKNITDIIIVGLAIDYCVYNTVLDAITYGFNTHLILECMKWVEESTGKKALEHMKTIGAKFYNTVDNFYASNIIDFN